MICAPRMPAPRRLSWTTTPVQPSTHSTQTSPARQLDRPRTPMPGAPQTSLRKSMQAAYLPAHTSPQPSAMLPGRLWHPQFVTAYLCHTAFTGQTLLSMLPAAHSLLWALSQARLGAPGLSVRALMTQSTTCKPCGLVPLQQLQRACPGSRVSHSSCRQPHTMAQQRSSTAACSRQAAWPGAPHLLLACGWTAAAAAGASCAGA